MPLVSLDTVTLERITKLAARFNITIELALKKAVNEYMDMTGDFLVESEPMPPPLRRSSRRK